ncbi:MAG: hypothetical protein U0987_20695 [Afipia sp.]|nr:hypothetical protein [Afipia sp.]
MGKPLFDDGVYTVTAALVSTPRRFYPLAHTTASIRRDPLWAAIAAAILAASCLAIYGDLLHLHEQIALVVVSAAFLLLGREIAILRIAAIGHAGAMIFGRRRRIQAVYEAIREARGTDRGFNFDIAEG